MINKEVLSEDLWIREFVNNNLCYESLLEYLEFIKRAIIEYDESQYGEYHHIIPRCIDTNNKYSDQVVKISGYNHLLAHCKLIYCFNDKEFKYKLSCAVHYMKPLIEDTDNPEKFAKEYNRAREVHSNLLKEKLTGTKRDKSTISKMSESQKRRYTDPKMRLQLSESHRGYKFSDEARSNMSKANKGSNNPMYGKHHSSETIRKMNESRKLKGYNLVCKICGKSFHSHAPNTKKCDECRNS